jgi:hypothetical protein
LIEILYAFGYILVHYHCLMNSDCSLMDLNFPLKRLSETDSTNSVV